MCLNSNPLKTTTIEPLGGSAIVGFQDIHVTDRKTTHSEIKLM